MRNINIKRNTDYLILLGIIIIVTVLGCKNETNTQPKEVKITNAQELVQAAVAYHDPSNNWKNFKYSVKINTGLRNSQNDIDNSTTELFLNNGNQEFTMYFKSDEIEHYGKVDKDTCFNATVKPISDEIEKKYSSILNCEGIKFYNNYYSYLIGQPMKLLDKEAIINDSIMERTYNGITYDVVKVNYEPINKSPAWYFYFDKDKHSLQLSKFTTPQDENVGGEYIIYKQEQKVEGMLLKGQQIWLHNNEAKDTLAVSNYKYLRTSNN